MKTNTKVPKTPFFAAFSVGAVLFSAHAGGGFATGNQANTYYVGLGWTGIISAIAAMLLLTLTMREAMIMYNSRGLTSYKQLFETLYHPFDKIEWAFELFFYIMVLMAVAAAISGAASALTTYFGLNYYIGVVAVGALVLVLTIFGAGIVRAASTYMGIAILVTAVAIYAVGIAWSGNLQEALWQDFTTQGFGNVPTAVLHAFTYAGFQCVTLPTMVACGTTMRSKQGCAKAMWISFVMNAVALVLSVFMLMSWQSVYTAVEGGSTIPTLTVCKIIGIPAMVAVYGTCLLLCLISTGVTTIFGFVARFEKLPLGVIQDKGTGTVKKLFVDDVDSLEVLLAHSMPEGIANLMIPIAVYVAMFFVDWKLALLSLASIPISLIAMMTMYSVGMKKMGPYYMAGQKMNNTIIEYINGMEVVKVFNKDADSYERFRKDVSDYRDYTLAWYKAAWPWMAIYSSLLPCTIILTLPVGAWFVLSGWSTLPNLILVLCLSLSIGMPLLKSLGFLPTMPQLNYKISALEQVLDAPELQQTEDAFHGKDDTITYDHVSFAYQTTQPGPDGKPVVIEDEVLHDISFTAKAGQKTALVGESGSGKSTLAKLLIHYYDPQKGSISIGGQKLCDMSLEALNSRISYVAQDQYLFNTSLFENIRLGRLNATDEEVVEAAKKAQCMEFLEKLPQGIHSMAGDAGKMLSGGQHQRISLARAILKDAPIVVLDEATAYADPENEEKMEAAIAELVKGKTLVVIAHKLPAIMNADQICVMDHGKLVATGKHQELIQSCPEYQKLWKAAQDSAEWKVHTAKEGK